MRILIALPRFPYPIEKGDKLRAFRQIQGLAKNHELHLVALNHEMPSQEDLDVVKKYCKTVDIVVSGKGKQIRNLFSSIFTDIPFQVHYFKSRTMKLRLARIAEQVKPDVMYVQLIRLGLSLPELNIPKYIDYMDSFSAGMEKRISLTAAWKKPFAKIESKRLAKFERKMLSRFEGYSIITAADLDNFPKESRAKFDVIPNGVSQEYLDYSPGEVEKKYDLIFTGNMGYHPNIQAAIFLVKEVLPLVKEDVRVCIAGARPSAEVKALASDRVEVTGFVDDLKSYMAASRLFIAPMISGSGLQNKLLESMAMGMPTITSELANRALGAEAGKQLIACNSAEQFAAEIVRLLGDETAAEGLGSNGRSFVESGFKWEHANGLLERALQRIIDQAD